MTSQEKLKQLESHFEFGNNWNDFSQKIDDRRINIALNSLKRILNTSDLSGKSFLDIGCGSGLFSLSALKLNATYVKAVDIDPKSVQTTQSVLQANVESNTKYDCEVKSVFDLMPKDDGQFDIVYSWGVLHHTGDMYTAIKKASKMVKNDGQLAIALYRKTPSCKFWKAEKRIYSNSPKFVQLIIQGIYTCLFSLGKLSLGTNPIKYIKEYKRHRGMSYRHDIHDWLGGYPYESISCEELKTTMAKFGFTLKTEFINGGIMSKLGLFGAICDEYLFIKT